MVNVIRFYDRPGPNLAGPVSRQNGCPKARSSLGESRQFHEARMGKICRNITASIGLIVFSQTASAALDSRVAMVGNSAYGNALQRDDPKNDPRLIAGILRDFSSAPNGRGAQFDLDKASLDLLAQAG